MDIVSIVLFIVSALFNISGGVALSISIIFWFTYFDHPFGIITLTTLTFMIVLIIITGAFIKSELWKINRNNGFLLLKMGVLNAIGGLLITYSSEPDRVPPVLQQFLINFIIFFSIIANKLILKDQKKYLNIIPIISLMLIISGTIFYSATIFALGEIHQEWYTIIIWSIVNLIGLFSMGLFGVYQTLYIKDKIENQEYTYIGSDNTIKKKLCHILVMLTYSKMVQSVIYILMYPVDFIPYLGHSNQDNFMDHFIEIFKCNFTLECGMALVFYIICVGGYMSYYLTNAYFNASSAPFSSMFSILIAPIVIIFWTCLPELDPNSNNVPIYAPIVSTTMNIMGMIIWKMWENYGGNSEEMIHDVKGYIYPKVVYICLIPYRIFSQKQTD